MKRIVPILLLFFGLQAVAQHNWPPAFTVSQDSVNYKSMPVKYWQCYDMGKDSVPFKKVSAASFDKNFTTYVLKEDEGNFNVTVGTPKDNVWLRYKLKNPDSQPLQIALQVNTKLATYYIGKEGSWKELTTGYTVPWSKRDGIKKYNYILYTLPANTEVAVYAYIYGTNHNKDLYPQPANYNTFVANTFHDRIDYDFDDIISSAFFGFIFFGVIFNLLFFYVNRERVYLVYSITLLVSAITVAGSIIDVAFFRENPKAGIAFQAICIFVLMFMILHTMRLFFRVKQYYPRWDRLLVVAPPVLFVLIFTSTLLPAGTITKNVITVLAGTALIAIIGFIIGTLIMVIAFLRKKNKEARLFVIAALPFLISLLLSFFTDYDFLILLSGMWAISILSWGMFARFKGLQIENARVALEKEEERSRLIAQQNELLEVQVAERTAELQQSLSELKQTQNQLIQSEKMASLGELTAGIAHEIQNPLNFVNNFSDVSIELLDEMEEELDKGDVDEVKALAGDIKQNLEKIAHHGRRADGIVKGMLQHSRASNNQKEGTDINALADEYFRLAYHGLRAKDKSFNADLVTDFSEGLPKINIIPQDVGRVLLNLFTNAFYATNQKKQADASYKPVVALATKQEANNIIITVKDNGTGIPNAIKEKILQPFFTTKPTGEGTGLGLSLSYDIVVKGHGGTIDIYSKEGEGAEFKITLPIN
ncbi:MAG: ATP-binding protein [Bacteroidota bacterium]